MRFVLLAALGLLAAAAACLPFTASEMENAPFFCRKDTDCPSGRVCAMPDGGITQVCSDPRIRCFNAAWDQDAGETDENCGGDCPKCRDSFRCSKDADCLSGKCAADLSGDLRCIPQCNPACTDGKRCLNGTCIMPKCTCNVDYCDPIGCLGTMESCNRFDQSCRWTCSVDSECPDQGQACQNDLGAPYSPEAGRMGYCMPTTALCRPSEVGFVCYTEDGQWGFMTCDPGPPAAPKCIVPAH